MRLSNYLKFTFSAANAAYSPETKGLVFVSLMQSDILGLNYDAPEKTFAFRPFSPSSGFSWNGIRYGDALFDVDFKRKDGGFEARVNNPNAYAVKLDGRFILGRKSQVRVLVNGTVKKVAGQKTTFLSQPAVLQEV